MNQQKRRKTKKNEEKNRILCTNVFKVANRKDRKDFRYEL